MKKTIKNIFSVFICLILSISVILGTVNFDGNIITAGAFDTAEQTVNKQKVYEYLTGVMGLNSAAACAVMANMSRESSFNPHALGDSGTSYGLCQWHDAYDGSGGRWTKLKNFCTSNGLDWTTVEGQMRYFQYEIETSYSMTRNALRSCENSARGAYDAAYTMCINFEVPANKEKVGAQRGYIAQSEFWVIYGGTDEKIAVNTDYASSITNTTAILTGSISKPANVNVSRCGVYLGTAEYNMEKSGAEIYIDEATNRSNGGRAFKVDGYTNYIAGKPYLNVTLKPGTKYFFQYYYIIGDIEYRGNVRSFTTTMSAEGIYITEEEVDLEYDYVAWYNKTNVNKGNGIDVTYRLTAKTVPDDANWTRQWSAANSADDPAGEPEKITINNGTIRALRAGKSVVTVTAENYSDTCNVYVGRLNSPKLQLSSAADGSERTIFDRGEEIAVTWQVQKSAGLHYMTWYKVGNDGETLIRSQILSSLNEDGTFNVPKDYHFTVDEPGTYRIELMIANTYYIAYGSITYEVVEKADKVTDTSFADAADSSVDSIGSLAGISMSLDGYLVLNYFIYPDADSLGTNMSMQFMVGGEDRTDNSYDVTRVGDRTAYRYECRLTATELTENISAKLVLGSKSSEIRTISAYDYCENIINNTSGNKNFSDAQPVIKAMMNYCGYAQKYFGKNTEKLANDGLFDNNPCLAELPGDVLASVGQCSSFFKNGVQIDSTDAESLSLGGLRYLGSSIQLMSGTDLRLYFEITDNNLISIGGYSIEVEGIGSISFASDNGADVLNENPVYAEEFEEQSATRDEAVIVEAPEEEAANVGNGFGEEEALETTDGAGAEEITEAADGAGAGEITGPVEESTVEEISGNEMIENESTEQEIIENEMIENESTAEEIIENEMIENESTEQEVMEPGLTESESLRAEENLLVDQSVTAELVRKIVATVNGQNLDCTISDNVVCLTVKNIPAQSIGDVIQFRITSELEQGEELVINYSPMCYILEMQKSDFEDGKILTRALYYYYKEIENYIS